MNGDVIVQHIHVPHSAQHNAHRLPRKLQGEGALVPGQTAHSLGEHLKQLFLVYRLGEVVQGRHLIALGDIVGIAGDEHDLNVLALLTDPLGQLHPVHPRHLNVQ